MSSRDDMQVWANTLTLDSVTNVYQRLTIDTELWDSGWLRGTGIAAQELNELFYLITDVVKNNTLDPDNNLSDVSDAETARTNLGLGGLSSEDTVNNDNWSGTDLSIANGGTGASTASGARDNLGLGDLAVLDTIDNDNWSGTDLAIENGGTGASSASDARDNLGLGDLATSDTINNSNWSGTDLAIVNGGTGASTASDARDNLGLGSIATADYTISTSSPSGGSDGDLWFLYTTS